MARLPACSGCAACVRVRECLGWMRCAVYVSESMLVVDGKHFFDAHARSASKKMLAVGVLRCVRVSRAACRKTECREGPRSFCA